MENRPSIKQGKNIRSKSKYSRTRHSKEPLEFVQLKNIYDNTVEQFADFLKDISPDLKSKLLNSLDDPKKRSYRIEESDTESDGQEETESSTPISESERESDDKVRKETLETSDNSSYVETPAEAESEVSVIVRGPAPGQTKLALAPILIEFAKNTVFPKSLELAADYIVGKVHSKNNLPKTSSGQGNNSIPKAIDHTVSGDFNPSYPQINYQNQDSSFPPQASLGLGYPAVQNPNPNYLQTTPLTYGDPSGYPSSGYQQPFLGPHQAIPPFVDPYQHQYLPGLSHEKTPRMTHHSNNQTQPLKQGYNTSQLPLGQGQYIPYGQSQVQPTHFPDQIRSGNAITDTSHMTSVTFAQYPQPTRSANHGLPAKTQISTLPSPDSTQSRNLAPSKTKSSNLTSHNVNNTTKFTDDIATTSWPSSQNPYSTATPQQGSRFPGQNDLPEPREDINKLKGEVIKSLEDIDVQINVILQKIE